MLQLTFLSMWFEMSGSCHQDTSLEGRGDGKRGILTSICYNISLTVLPEISLSSLSL
jgi:hypothetical protein